MLKKSIRWGLVFFICVSFLNAQSQTCTIYADHDCLVSKSNPNTNYNQTQLEVGITDGHVRMSFLHFNLESLPANAFIEKAELLIYCTKNVGVESIEITEAANSWDETTITWNNMPDVRSSANYYFRPDNSYPYWNNIDVSYSVLLWYLGDSENFGFRLDKLLGYDNRWATFFSKESSQNLYTPKLIITYNMGSEPDPVPDISINDIWFEGTDNIVQGEPFDFHVEFTNIGDAVANDIKIYYEAYYNGKWNEIGDDSHSSLDAGDSREEHEDCLGDYISGNVTFRVRIPAVTNEKNSSNNIKSITWDVITPTKDEWIYYLHSLSGSRLSRTVWRMRPNGSNREVIKMDATNIAISDDNKYILYKLIYHPPECYNEFYRMSLENSNIQNIPVNNPLWATFVPDNSNVIYFLAQSDLYKYVFSNSELRNLTNDISISTKIMPDLSPNGKYLAFAANQSDLFILNLETNQTNLIADNISNQLGANISWRGNNNIYYIGEKNENSYPQIWQVNVLENYKHEVNTNSDMAFSPNILKCNKNNLIFISINILETTDDEITDVVGKIKCYNILTNVTNTLFTAENQEYPISLEISPSDNIILFEIEREYPFDHFIHKLDFVEQTHCTYSDHSGWNAIWAGEEVQLDEFIDPYYGDVNKNNEIQTDDALLILRNVINMSDSHLDRLAFYNADLTVNDSISALDASLILQYIYGKIEYLPIFKSRDIYNSRGDIVMEDVQFNSYDTVNIPIYLENSKNVYSLSGEISFDDSVLSFVDLVLPESGSDILEEAFANNGKVKFALASKDTLKNNQVFLLVFSIDQNQYEEEVNITIDKIQLNENNSKNNLDEITFRINTSIEQEPTKFYLLNNYPNPFNPITKLKYTLPEQSNIKLNIYDITGRKIKEWSVGNQQAGWHKVIWDGTDMSGNTVSTGVYIYSLQAGNFVDTKKMVFMK